VPILSRGISNRAGVFRGAVAFALVMERCPGGYLLFSQRGKGLDVAQATVSGQQLGKRGTAFMPTQPIAQGVVNLSPSCSQGSTQDGAGVHLRPVIGAAVVQVGPWRIPGIDSGVF